MIVNSQPYNPSQQSEQRRCIGINQRNSIYGSELPTSNTAADMSQLSRQQNHMSDLASLQQEQQQQATNLFDSAYDDTTNSLAALATFNQSDHLLSSQTGKMVNNSISRQQQQTTDVSLYSPSSSTSLLYHHYDQINVPNEQQQSVNNQNFKRSHTTTILNPSDLFGQSTMSFNQHNNMPAQQAASQQHFMTTNKTKIAQQELYSNSAQYHLNQPSTNHNMHHLHYAQQQQLNSTYGLDNHQLMLDTILRQQHAPAAATTLSRTVQHTAGYHNRPLSSSGASSMSGQSMALTYGRQPRQAGTQLPPLPPINSSKSQNTLASVLQSNQTLNHFGLGLANGHLTHTMMDHRNPKKLSQHQFHSSSSAVGGTNAVGGASRRWKRAQRRLQNFAYAHGTLLRCCVLLIIIAFTLLSIIKFNSTINSPRTNSQQTRVVESARPDVDLNRWAVTEQFVPSESSTLPPDVLSSKLLTGEFVITSQNLTGFEAQRSILAENIVKLMDQVFLSTDMRRLYSRMRVREILPHKPSGVLVKCNIILSESIAYAAQQFGIALYDSLAKSNEKLANHPNFIIDKNSIRFNTIPDKDLSSVPAQLLPPDMIRPDGAPTPSDGSLGTKPQSPRLSASAVDLKQSPPGSSPPDDRDPNAVVWSEWSSWSSCVDKSGSCDSTRLHSRVRECISQHTGDKVDAGVCKRRFDILDQEFEVTDCASTCAVSTSSSVLSDAPHVILPLTAPSVLMNGPSSEPPSFMSPKQLNRPSAERIGPLDPLDNVPPSPPRPSGVVQDAHPNPAPSPPPSGPFVGDLFGNNRQQQQQPVSTPISIAASTLDSVHVDNSQLSCSNCTSDHICLLLINQKVPFCAKIKDRLDESGCGGWCKAGDQICQPAGQNAFKCTHNNECLPSEWRCNDSACIPASKRCDGHENCFDSSDEQFCPS